MKNMVGGFIASVIGSIMIVSLAGMTQIYPAPFDVMWIFLTGATGLHPITLIVNSGLMLPYITTWIVMGCVEGLFSDSKWNAVRTAMWVAIIITLLSLVSALIIDPALWNIEQTQRNWSLVLHLVGSLLISMTSLVGAIPVVSILGYFRREREIPPPERIETICDCGAVFKSNPMLCSECGSSLREVVDTSLVQA
ncbi:MAG: hypothetical protein RTU30_01965 [Candidatus Thorarchaeota archaeon]